MGFWKLIAEANGIEVLIKIGLVLVFMVGPYLLKMLGGSAVQDDRGQGRKKREPQTDLEREIAEFLRQSQSGGQAPSDTVPAMMVDEHEEGGYVQAEAVQTTLRDHHLESKVGTHPSIPDDESSMAEHHPYIEEPQESFEDSGPQYDEAEEYNYDSETKGVAAAGVPFAEMFRDPTKVRNAFIFAEIMNRPKFPRQ
ncbi:hypothetical protein GC197_13915 [bacterium]|nr:hypothetical protein [bacterium]